MNPDVLQILDFISRSRKPVREVDFWALHMPSINYDVSLHYAMRRKWIVYVYREDQPAPIVELTDTGRKALYYAMHTTPNPYQVPLILMFAFLILCLAATVALTMK